MTGRKRTSGQISQLYSLAITTIWTVLLALPVGAAEPFSEPERPPTGIYDGPVFNPSYAYPATVPPADQLFPWQEAIGGESITTSNAAAYVVALKEAIAPDMTRLVYNFENWDAASAGWYNQPWLSSIRDGVHGTYVGSKFPPAMFPASGLKAKMATHDVVYYDKRAAGSLGKVWGNSGLDPVPAIEAGGAQFAEGSLIVKLAFTTADETIWPPMAGAANWFLWTHPFGNTNAPKQLFSAGFFQLDIIAKDTRSSAQTNWVFTTLVYDKDAPGLTNWEKMVPLGVMWGNDPEVNSPIDCNYLPPVTDCPALSETWINPAAPLYAKETLGWGGRLSGPNDGAVDINAAILQQNGTNIPYTGRFAMSSCMSCHSSAEYLMKSFLLPSAPNCSGDSCGPSINRNGQIVYYQAGNIEFMRWFQNRTGNVPMDAGSSALDYGMNYAFKSLPKWFSQTGQTGVLDYVREFNDYRGISPDHQRLD